MFLADGSFEYYPEADPNDPLARLWAVTGTAQILLLDDGQHAAQLSETWVPSIDPGTGAITYLGPYGGYVAQYLFDVANGVPHPDYPLDGGFVYLWLTVRSVLGAGSLDVTIRRADGSFVETTSVAVTATWTTHALRLTLPSCDGSISQAVQIRFVPQGTLEPPDTLGIVLQLDKIVAIVDIGQTFDNDLEGWTAQQQLGDWWYLCSMCRRPVPYRDTAINEETQTRRCQRCLDQPGRDTRLGEAAANLARAESGENRPKP